MIDTKDLEKDVIVEDALRIATVLNRHLSEPECHHNIREIATEALGT